MARLITGISFLPDYDRIFSRLGYKRKSTSLDNNFRKEIISWVDEAASVIKLNASTAVCSIEFPEENTISFLMESTGKNISGKNEITEEDVFSEIKSASLFRFLKGSGEILAMGITGGKPIMELIESCQKDNMTKAVVLDAAAGEIVDSGLDFVVSLFNRELARGGRKLLAKRFSPGYGDLQLGAQKDFFNLLEMSRLEVELSSSLMLLPQKSVIALTGIV